jgi:hypothetical protein
MKRSATALLHEFQLFFAGIPGFVQVKLDGRIRFIWEVPQKNLRILVTTPVVCYASETVDLASGLHIEFAVQYDRKTCLEFQDSRVIQRRSGVDEWKKVTTDKVATLIELIEDIEMCPRCQIFPYPFEDSAPQGRPYSTHFVWCRCPGCKQKYETKYGTGLRTSISRYRKKS